MSLSDDSAFSQLGLLSCGRECVGEGDSRERAGAGGGGPFTADLLFSPISKQLPQQVTTWCRQSYSGSGASII